MSALAPKVITREQAIQEAWHRGRLSFLLHSGQKLINQKFNESKNQLFVCNISRQWGKSYFAVTKAIELALSKPKARIKYATAFQTDLVEFILPTFDTVLESCPIDLKPTYKAQGSKWVFKNGAELKLVGLDKSPNGLRGNTIDLIIIDEAGFVGNLDYVYTSIIVPATLHRPNAKIIFISTPPSTPAHAFIDFIQKAEAEGSYVKLTIYDNPLITQEDVERMAKEVGGFQSTTFRREFLCELITDGDLAIIPEWNDEYVQEPVKDELYSYWHKYVSLDLGVKDFTAGIFAYYNFKQAVLYVEDEITLNGPSLTTDLLQKEIKSKEQELWGETKPFRRISDNNNLMLIQDLSSIHNLHFNPTGKDTLEAMINEVRLLVQAGRIKINPKCKKTIGCLKYGAWNRKKTEFSRSKTYGHFDHLAALIYLVRNLAQHSNPIPADRGYAHHNSYIPKTIQQTNNTQVIKNLFKPKAV